MAIRIKTSSAQKNKTYTGRQMRKHLLGKIPANEGSTTVEKKLALWMRVAQFYKDAYNQNLSYDQFAEELMEQFIPRHVQENDNWDENYFHGKCFTQLERIICAVYAGTGVGQNPSAQRKFEFMTRVVTEIEVIPTHTEWVEQTKGSEELRELFASYCEGAEIEVDTADNYLDAMKMFKSWATNQIPGLDFLSQISEGCPPACGDERDKAWQPVKGDDIFDQAAGVGSKAGDGVLNLDGILGDILG